jgi:DNA-binding CsgD family transcriptional regulator
VATLWFCATEAAASAPLGAFAALFSVRRASRWDPLERSVHALDELRRRGKGRGLVVGVDDAHLLDPAGAGFLHLLGQAEFASLVVTASSEKPSPDTVRALWKDGDVERIDLMPIVRSTFEHLVSEVLGGPVEGSTVDNLWKATRGHLGLLRDLFTAGRESGVLAQDNGVWGWQGPLGGSRQLREVVAERLRGLSPAERSLLEMLAIGEALPASVVEHLAPACIIESLEEARLIETERGGRDYVVRISSPVDSAVITASVPILRARSLRRRLAVARGASEQHRRDGNAPLALWRPRASEAPDPSTLVAAAHHGLTPRQCEVAGLAAAGLSNQEIARRLFVSCRTVENHLYQIFAKLNVTSRDELGPALGVGRPDERQPATPLLVNAGAAP